MNLIELGAKLRQAREKKNLSLEEVTEGTKISRRIILAFEDGDREGFPHPVYAKGFIKNYARMLGLDPDECLRVVDREYCRESEEGEGGLGGATIKTLAETPVEDTLKRTSWPTILLTLFLVVLLGWLIWHFSVVPGRRAALSQESAHVEEPREAPATHAEESPQAMPKVSVQAGVEAAQAEDGKLVPASAKLEMRFIGGDGGSWVGIWPVESENMTPEEMIKDFTVRQNETVTEISGRPVKVRIGRVEAITLSVNGEVRELQGQGVVNLTLP